MGGRHEPFEIPRLHPGLRWLGRTATAVTAIAVAHGFVAPALARAFHDLLGPLLSPDGADLARTALVLILPLPAWLTLFAVGVYGAAAAYRASADLLTRDELSEQSMEVTVLTVLGWSLLRVGFLALLLIPTWAFRPLGPLLPVTWAGLGCTLFAVCGPVGLEIWLDRERMLDAFRPKPLCARLRHGPGRLWAIAGAQGALLAGTLTSLSEGWRGLDPRQITLFSWILLAAICGGGLVAGAAVLGAQLPGSGRTGTEPT